MPSDKPPVGFAYQLMVPALDVAPIVTVPVPQIDAGMVVNIVGADKETVAATDVLLAVVQIPAVASTKYVVVKEIKGVVNVNPVPSDKPPVGFAYQFMVPELAVAPSVTTPVPQREPGVDVNIVGVTTDTVAITDVLAAVVHIPLVAST